MRFPIKWGRGSQVPFDDSRTSVEGQNQSGGNRPTGNQHTAIASGTTLGVFLACFSFASKSGLEMLEKLVDGVSKGTASSTVVLCLILVIVVGSVFYMTRLIRSHR